MTRPMGAITTAWAARESFGAKPGRYCRGTASGSWAVLAVAAVGLYQPIVVDPDAADTLRMKDVDAILPIKLCKWILESELRDDDVRVRLARNPADCGDGIDNAKNGDWYSRTVERHLGVEDDGRAGRAT